MTAVSDETGRGWLPLKYEDGPDFYTITFATGAAFALTVHPERMKLMEAALSAAPVAIKPLRWVVNNVWGHQKCRGISAEFGEIDAFTQDGLSDDVIAAKKADIETEYARRIKACIVAPPATPAGVGADEIRSACIEHASLNMTVEAAHQQADRITAAILALLSRGSGSDQKRPHEA